MEKTLNKKTIIRLSTFVLIITLLIPLSIHLFDEKISEENKLQEVSLDLEVIIGHPSARLSVTPDPAIRKPNMNPIHVIGWLHIGSYNIPDATIYVLWNNTEVNTGTTGSDGTFDIPLYFNHIRYREIGNINVTAWYQGDDFFLPQSTSEFITVYATSRMDINLSSQIVNPGGSFDAYLTLSYDNGTRLANANAYLRLWNGTEYGPQVTDFNGQTTFTIDVSSSEPTGLDKPVRGAADVSTIPGVSPYLLGSTGTIGETWANNTASIDVLIIAIITFDVSADTIIGNLPNPPIPALVPTIVSPGLKAIGGEPLLQTKSVNPLALNPQFSIAFSIPLSLTPVITSIPFSTAAFIVGPTPTVGIETEPVIDGAENEAGTL